MNNPMLPPMPNEAQRQAITHDGSHLLIMAGPGTGKTHTLIHRIARLKKLFPDQGMLAITFTQKAACEMKERLKALGMHDSKIFVGTFHSFCLEILKRFSEYTGLPSDFKIVNEEEIEALLKGRWRDKPISWIKKALEEVFLWKMNGRDIPLPALVKEYNDSLRENHSLDFDDLLIEARKLFEANISIKNQIQEEFPFIFVDEYQDINRIQHELLKLLIGPQSSLTVIGDPNQAIYSFRGSDAEFFTKFNEDFFPSRILSLVENFRSTPNLLAASGQVIKKSKFPVLELTANIYTQGHLTVFAALSEKAEAHYVVHEIEKLVGGLSMFSQDSGRVASFANSSYSFGDMAILYRLNAQRKILEEALGQSGIPYQVAGEKPPHEENFEIRTEKVNLLTMHASKGLEFSVVFIIGCEEGLIPLRLENFKTNEEEERRLFYVAMTRAKERLYFIYVQKRRLFGKMYTPSISPFVHDIEEQLKEYETARNSQKSGRKKEQARQIQLFKF